jgi:Family of unknown function (DUF6090)
MINLFRKLRHSFIDNKQMGKYLKYSIGEIVLVMIGILLAVQVNNWNIKRGNRAKEIKYLQNIQLDIQKDLISLTSNLETRKNSFIGNKRLIEHAKGNEIEDITELVSDIANTLNEKRFTPNNTTYKELSSSGNLNIISNDSIKQLLLQLEEHYNTNEFGIEHETFDYQEYISKPAFSLINLEQIWPIAIGEKTVQEQGISKKDFVPLFQNKKYKNGLMVLNLMTQDYVIPLYEDILSKSELLEELIEKELTN